MPYFCTKCAESFHLLEKWRTGHSAKQPVHFSTLPLCMVHWRSACFAKIAVQLITAFSVNLALVIKKSASLYKS